MPAATAPCPASGAGRAADGGTAVLLTVDGARTARELAALVKALMDWCTDGGRGGLDTALTQVAKRCHISVPEVQREQVYAALAAVPPAAVPPTGFGQGGFGQGGARPPHDQKALYTLLTAAWVDLCAQAQAEATRENEEHDRAPRDPVAEAIRRLTLSGRYYVVAHNGRGKPLLSRPVIGLGLAAGTIAELVIAGRISLDTRTHHLLRVPGDGGAASYDRVTETVARPTPSRAAERVLEETPAQSTPLRDHLVSLSARVEEWVCTELAESGLVTAETHGMLRERVYYAPCERGLATAVRTLLGGALHTDPIAMADAVLAELVIATALDARHSGAWDRLPTMTRGDALAESRRPAAAAQLKLLVDLTAAEVDTLVTSPRT